MLFNAKSWLIGKDSDVGRDWGQEEKGMTEDEMAGWHHWLDAREFEWAPTGDRQGGLACCNSWGRKESDTTERLNWTELNFSDTSCLKPQRSEGSWGPALTVCICTKNQYNNYWNYFLINNYILFPAISAPSVPISSPIFWVCLLNANKSQIQSMLVASLTGKQSHPYC